MHRRNVGQIALSDVNFGDWKERANQKVL